MENPGTFRTEMFVSSWAEHLRQLARITKSESEAFHRVLGMHVGGEMPVVRHYLRANRRSTPLGFGQFRKRLEAWFTSAMQASLESKKSRDGAECETSKDEVGASVESLIYPLTFILFAPVRIVSGYC